MQLNLRFNNWISWLVLFKQDLHFEMILVSLCDYLIGWLLLFLQSHSNSVDKLLTQVSSDLVNNLFVSTNLILCLIVLIIGLSFWSTYPVSMWVSAIVKENVIYFSIDSAITEISWLK